MGAYPGYKPQSHPSTPGVSCNAVAELNAVCNHSLLSIHYSTNCRSSWKGMVLLLKWVPTLLMVRSSASLPIIECIDFHSSHTNSTMCWLGHCSQDWTASCAIFQCLWRHRFLARICQGWKAWFCGMSSVDHVWLSNYSDKMLFYRMFPTMFQMKVLLNWSSIQ